MFACIQYICMTHVVCAHNPFILSSTTSLSLCDVPLLSSCHFVMLSLLSHLFQRVLLLSTLSPAVRWLLAHCAAYSVRSLHKSTLHQSTWHGSTRPCPSDWTMIARWEVGGWCVLMGGWCVLVGGCTGV